MLFVLICYLPEISSITHPSTVHTTTMPIDETQKYLDINDIKQIKAIDFKLYQLITINYPKDKDVLIRIA